MSTTIEQSLELNVPARTAYDQWTQFEEFPRFMSRIDTVEQLDDRHVRIRARAGRAIEECELEICEQIPDKRIAWKTVEGPWTAGVVTFHRIDDDHSRIMVQLAFIPKSFGESARDEPGLAERALQEELESFRRFIEQRGTATGGWRGAIPSKASHGA